MKIIECVKCGSNDLFEENRYVVCAYCRVKFVPSVGDLPSKRPVIAVYDDIQELLLRCKNEPESRRRIAGLILNIDPGNVEAKNYLK